MNFLKKLFNSTEEKKTRRGDYYRSGLKLTSSVIQEETIRMKKELLIDQKERDLRSERVIELKPRETYVTNDTKEKYQIYGCVCRRDLAQAEKLVVELIAQTDNVYEKFRIVDEFSYLPNGMMSRDTHTWIRDTTAELYLLLFNLDIGIRYKCQALYYILRSEIDTERKQKAIHEMESIIDVIGDDIPTDLLSDVYDKLKKAGTPEALTLSGSVRKIIQHRDEKKTRNEKTVDAQLNRRIDGTIYSDSQNVHAQSVEESVEKVINQLAEDVYYNSVDVDSDTAVIEKDNRTVEELIQVFSEAGLMNEQLQKSLNRICIDTVVFSRYQYRTRDVLQKVWLRIKHRLSPELRDDAIRYLAEELKESSDICSSGFVARIVNVLSRFDLKDGGVKAVTLTFDEQIKANIQARVRTRIQSSSQHESILVDMIRPDPRLYHVFLLEIRDSVYNELYPEFAPHLPRKEFDQIFHKYYSLLYK